MALIHIDGFDGGDYNLGKYNAYNGNVNVILSTATRYGTGFCLAASGFAGAGLLVRKDFIGVSKIIAGVAHRSSSFDNDASLITTYGDNGTVNHINLRVLLTGAIAIYRGATQVAISDPNVCTPNAWHYYELSTTLADSGGICSARVDGVTQASFTGDTRNGGTALTIDRVDLASIIGSNWFFDDFYLADGTGSAPWNTFLGDVRVQTVRPMGAGSSTNLSPIGSTSNWDNVNEAVPSMADYNYSTTPGARDLYAMEDISLGTTSVLGVQVVTLAHKNDASPRSIKNLLKSGATVYASPVKALAATPTPTISLYQTDPATGAQWTPTAVNAIEAGVEVV